MAQRRSPIEDPSYDLPEWWTVAFPCAVDVPERVLSDVIVSYSPSTAIPYECALYCEAQGYYFAGVEYGDECYCGTGYSGGIPPTAANVSDCSMRCAGDYFYACGGSWRMQIYYVVVTDCDLLNWPPRTLLLEMPFSVALRALHYHYCFVAIGVLPFKLERLFRLHISKSLPISNYCYNEEPLKEALPDADQ